MITILLSAGLLAGCSTNRRFSGSKSINRIREEEFYWGTATSLAFNGPVAGTAEIWCQDANDHSLKRERRCLGAALVFAAYVRPGFNSTQMRTGIPDPRWLGECKLEDFSGGTGRQPFLYSRGSHFTLRLFPADKEEEDRDWTIYFTLSDKAARALSVKEAFAFLSGTHADKKLQIMEFEIMYPIPGCGIGTYVEEMHVPWGVGMRIYPLIWF